MTVCGGKALHTIRSATQILRISVPALRSSLKTVHRTVFFTLRPSQVQILQNEKENSHRVVTVSFWLRRQDLNLHPLVVSRRLLHLRLQPTDDSATIVLPSSRTASGRTLSLRALGCRFNLTKQKKNH